MMHGNQISLQQIEPAKNPFTVGTSLHWAPSARPTPLLYLSLCPSIRVIVALVLVDAQNAHVVHLRQLCRHQNYNYSKVCKEVSNVVCRKMHRNEEAAKLKYREKQYEKKRREIKDKRATTTTIASVDHPPSAYHPWPGQARPRLPINSSYMYVCTPPLHCTAPSTHSKMGTTIRNFLVGVHGTPFSSCSHTVSALCSPWSSPKGEPRFQWRLLKDICV
jgi:hypothetical protein